MPKTATVTSKPGSKIVFKTFAKYFDKDGEEVGIYSVGLGYVDDVTADERAHRKAPHKAKKYKLFDGSANLKGFQKIIELRPRPHMNKRTLRTNM